jgi:dihydroxyacid dehydratase/phosphogluconate dehydratase
MALDMAFGGSSNTVLHRRRCARANADITLDDWAAVSAKTPNPCASARRATCTSNLYAVGGIPTIMRERQPRADLSMR